MKWFDSIINNKIVKIVRFDSAKDYEFMRPFGLFIMFDQVNGLLIQCINDAKSIQISLVAFPKVLEEYEEDYQIAKN